MSGDAPSNYQRTVYYSSHRFSEVPIHTKISNPLSDTELSNLTIKIERGTLTKIELVERNLSNEQFVKLMVSCMSATSIVEEIDVSNSQIGDSAIKELVHTLSGNTKIRKINLAYSNVSDDAVDHLMEILRSNLTITSINLFKNPISIENLLRLRPFLDRNIEIETELKKSKYYLSLRAELVGKNFSNPLVCIILDYYNDAKIPEAREVIAKILYRTSLPLTPLDAKTTGSSSISQNALLFSHSQQARAQDAKQAAEFTTVQRYESHGISLSQGEISTVKSQEAVTKSNEKLHDCVIL